ncbi:MAG: hypothetical protein EBU52_08990 [Cytophagia bacterium]|nr:hypothetical protein [Cytophagia bacterium]
MKTKLLFPRKFKYVGLVISIVFFAMGIANLYFQFTFDVYTPFKVYGVFLGGWGKDELTEEILGVGLIIGLLLTAFSREKLEDEFVGKMRAESLMWAVYVNYIILIFSFLCVYGEAFLQIMVYNLFTILIFFIGRFNFLMYRHLQTPEID